jgi:glycosyltransferase involved in cell wall biosynthesis
LTQILWIDWGRHPRTHSLAKRLAADLVEITDTGRGLRRYLRSASRTVASIRTKQPRVVIATNPSIVLGYLLLVLRRWYGFRLVSDAHYFGVAAPKGRRFMQWLLDFHNVRVNLVIVTNANHAELLRQRGARTYICEDPLPTIPVETPPVDPRATNYVFLISSFDEDEPYEAACESFSPLAEAGCTLLVSGDYQKAQIDPSRFRGVRFLGFLPEDEYYSYLKAASIVMDLTNLEDCLVCGAYEALALKKPLILSRTKALTDHFGTAAVFVDNTVDAIRQGVLAARAQSDHLTCKAEEWVIRNDAHMADRIAGLKSALLGCAFRQS